MIRSLQFIPVRYPQLSERAKPEQRMVCFTGYNTNSDSIEISGKDVNDNVHSNSGCVSIIKSKIDGSVDTNSGDIFIYYSTITGSVESNSGNIQVKHGQPNVEVNIGGNIRSTSGNIELEDVTINGDVILDTDSGFISAKKVNINGTLKVPEYSDDLIGCKISNLTIKKDDSSSESDSGIYTGGGITIKNIIGPVTVGNTASGGNKKTNKTSEPAKPQVFRLKPGNTISGTVKFESGNGKLIVEKGATFSGKVEGGIVRNLNDKE